MVGGDSLSMLVTSTAATAELPLSDSPSFLSIIESVNASALLRRDRAIGNDLRRKMR